MRTTAEAVKQIMDTTLDDTIVESYIQSASTLLDNTLDGYVDDDLLVEIERWLSAHMIASTRERQAMEEEAGGAKIKYAGNFGESLSSTSYGQMVLTLDTSGKLKLLFTKKASVRNVEGY